MIVASRRTPRQTGRGFALRRYGALREWDMEMNAMEIKFGSMIKPHQYVTLAHEGDKLIAYEKGDLVYVFNFHPNNSYTEYKIGTFWPSDHFVLYESDEDRFGGFQRLNDAHGRWYESFHEECHNRPYSINLYIPARSCIVLCPYEKCYNLDIPGMPQVTDR